MDTASLTQARLKELLYYNPQFGIFVWRKTNRKMTEGVIAGRVNNNGYCQIGLNYKRYSAHRLAFLYMNGSFPSEAVDHINGISTDNRWINLRAVSLRENLKNMRLSKNNRSGLHGVILNTSTNKWSTQINSNTKNLYLGAYSDFFEACCARKSAELKHGYHPNHGRRT